MKKFICILAAVFTIMISCAAPLLSLHATDNNNHATINNFPDSLNAIKNQGYSGITDNSHYIYCNYDIYYNYASEERSGAFVVRYNDNNINNLYVEYSHNTLVLRTLDLSNTIDVIEFHDYYGVTNGTYYACAVTFDFNTNECSFVDNNADYINASYYDQNATSFSFYNFDTNFSEYNPQSLSLSFSFAPTMSGTVSRNETINGKQYTSKTLDVYVTNNGSDAQWLLAIVPSGDSLTFPESTLENNQGFLGGPTFVYVTDEFSTFNIANGQTSIYAGCAWRAIPSGYSNQPYHILWSSIDLKANTSYDLVCYGALNPDSIITNAASGGGFNMRGNFSVTSDLSTVEEVYRSTFTISDPAVFDPNIIDEAGTGHAWNPNADNSHLFTNAAAYRDDNGNLIIRGFSNGGADYTAWSDTIPDTSLSQATANVFSFVASFFKLFPSNWLAMIYMGICAIVVIAVIKKGTS